MVADCSAFVAIGRFYLQSNTARIVPSTLIIKWMRRFSGPTNLTLLVSGGFGKFPAARGSYGLLNLFI
jgi:hypothetical protein